MGWNFDVSVQADSGEAIAQVEVRVNDFPDVRDNLNDPVDSWAQTLTQKGVFPGDNKAVVTVLSDAEKRRGPNESGSDQAGCCCVMQ
jgi:hypothetical protein